MILEKGDDAVSVLLQLLHNVGPTGPVEGQGIDILSEIEMWGECDEIAYHSLT